MLELFQNAGFDWEKLQQRLQEQQDFGLGT